MRRRLVSALLAVILAGQGALAWGGTAIAAIAAADTPSAAGPACAMACCKRVGGMSHAAMAGRPAPPPNASMPGMSAEPAESTAPDASSRSCAASCGWSRGRRAAGTLVPTAPFLLPAAVRLPAPAGPAPRPLGLTPAVGEATPGLPERPPRA
jgi:hypothetical protein